MADIYNNIPGTHLNMPELEAQLREAFPAPDTAPRVEPVRTDFKGRAIIGHGYQDMSVRTVNMAPSENEPRTKSGAPIGNRELRDDDIVMVDGMGVSVQVARRLDLIPAAGGATRPFGDAPEGTPSGETRTASRTAPRRPRMSPRW